MLSIKILFITLALNLLFVNSPAQILNTNLTLTVRNELGNTVEGATVTLYENKEDYLSEKNGVATAVTNKKGVAMFKKLEPKKYFLTARKDKADNRGAGESLTLKKGRINKATVVIE